MASTTSTGTSSGPERPGRDLFAEGERTNTMRVITVGLVMLSLTVGMNVALRTYYPTTGLILGLILAVLTVVLVAITRRDEARGTRLLGLLAGLAGIIAITGTAINAMYMHHPTVSAIFAGLLAFVTPVTMGLPGEDEPFNFDRLIAGAVSIVTIAVALVIALYTHNPLDALIFGGLMAMVVAMLLSEKWH